MTLSTYLLFLAAVTMLVLTPGPTMLMCVTNALNHGPARALASVAGALAASFAWMGLSALGLGAVLAASETGFTVLKVLGAAYLVWLGVRTFRSTEPPPQPSPGGRGSMLAQGFVVGASNPKALLFFAAFFPQFIDPAAAFWPQFLLLSLTFVAGDSIVMLVCALAVGRIAHLLRDLRVLRWINRACGGLFALMGGALLFARRQA
ncbi:MAG: LysE family translocator [Burkholderiales bacterium]|nr:LysE family translocator [Burkholderiales bacterium]